MTRIRANRESIDDRFSVLGFTVNADQPLYEIALATEPDLLRPENRARRTAANFYASSLQSARPRSDAVYMVPPAVVARFVGQPRLYFGVATYADNDRGKPVSVRRPDAGTMYVSLRGLTERGLRRGVRAANGGGYGAPHDRDPARVARDADRGWIDVDVARDIYGVVLVRVGNGVDHVVDQAATGRLRADLAEKKH